MNLKVYCIQEKNGHQSIIIVINNFFNNTDKIQIVKNLNNIDNWYHGKAFGREIPRLQRWYHLNNKKFSPFWKTNYKRWESNIYEDWLLELQNNLQSQIYDILDPLCNKFTSLKNINFNSVLINKYMNGSHFIKQHRDDESIFNNNPSIVSVSFGETRTFIMQRVIYNKNNPKSMKRNLNEKYLDLKIPLKNGTILIMGGSTQKYYSHGIPKEEHCKKKRYNMTFRYSNPIKINN